MTTSTKPTITLREPSQLIAALPHLLGFRPTESAVLIGHSAPDGKRVGYVLRGDLPPDEHVPDQARYLATTIANGRPAGVTLVIVGRRADARDGPGEPPHAGFVEALTGALTRLSVPVLHAMWVPDITENARWQCYQDSTCGGRLPDPSSTVAAAASASTGAVTYSSREAMAAQLDPDDEGALARRSALLDTACARLGDPPDDLAIARAAAAVRAALGQAATGRLALTDDDVTRLAMALSEHQIRDACLATALPPGGSGARNAERLWLALIRATPPPERAQPACLLAYSAYVRGDGALAGIALENALDADPGHLLAGLLHRVAMRGVHPRHLLGLGHIDGLDTLAAPARRTSPGPLDDPG